MLKPPMPNVTGVTDTLDFIKNLWGGMNVPGVNVPGMTGPAMSTDELDKKIADLKAVESWLNLNMTMLRGTIQALEVQRGTIATLRAMHTSMAQAMGQAAGEGMAGMGAPFQSFFTPPGAAPAQQAQASAQPPQPGAQPPGAQRPAGASQPAGAQPQAGTQQQAGTSSPSPAAPPPGAAAMMPAAVAWWNLLQDQFKQAVSSTMSPEAMANAAAMAQDAAARFGAAATAPASAASAAPAAGAEASNASAQPGVSKPRNGKPKADKS
jgi:hypothetical protein